VRNNASSEDEWTEIVLRMVGNGAQLSEDDEATEIIDYLTEGGTGARRRDRFEGPRGRLTPR
jgi:hypothetical protein